MEILNFNIPFRLSVCSILSLFRYDSQSSSTSTGSCAKGRKGRKPTVELDSALVSLHSEPSGWGDLPSPKPTDVDNGTEIWGVAPDDIHRKSRSSNCE